MRLPANGHWHHCNFERCPNIGLCFETNCEIDQPSWDVNARRYGVYSRSCAAHRMVDSLPSLQRPDIEAIVNRFLEATPGPWGYQATTRDGSEIFFQLLTQKTHHEHPSSPRYLAMMYGALGPLRTGNPDNDLNLERTFNRRIAADAEFISHARSDIPALVAYIRQLEEERLEKTLPPDATLRQALRFFVSRITPETVDFAMQTATYRIDVNYRSDESMIFLKLSKMILFGLANPIISSCGHTLEEVVQRAEEAISLQEKKEQESKPPKT